MTFYGTKRSAYQTCMNQNNNNPAKCTSEKTAMDNAKKDMDEKKVIYDEKQKKYNKEKAECDTESDKSKGQKQNTDNFDCGF